jgi:phage regulator Rha-like protein
MKFEWNLKNCRREVQVWAQKQSKYRMKKVGLWISLSTKNWMNFKLLYEKKFEESKRGILEISNIFSHF